MAKKPNLLPVAALFRGNTDYSGLSDSQIVEQDPLRQNMGRRLYSVAERDHILQPVTPRQSDTAKLLNSTSLSSYISDVTQAIGSTAIDNDKILAMAPEVGQAAELVIPSIISPNDMRHGNIVFSVDHDQAGISPGKAEEIRMLINDHLNTELGVSDSLPEWIREALYRSGAKVLMTIPSSELDRVFQDLNETTNISVEQISAGIDKSIEGTGSVCGIAAAFNDREVDIRELRPGIEGALNTYRSDNPDSIEDSKLSGTDASSYDSKIESIAGKVLSTEAFEVIDNPDILKSGSFKRKRKQADIRKSVSDRYKPRGLISFDEEAAAETEQLDHPMFMELPTESCIPLYIPGSPQSHIGYFIAIDEKGQPLSIDEDSSDKESLYQDLIDSSRRSPFDELFKAYGLKELQNSLAGQSQSSAMSEIYRHVIEYHLRSRLSKSGLAEVETSSMNAIYGHMFSRYLEGRKTRLLFVPTDFITYMTYRYNRNGTGRSKLEDIKFILALRITLLIANTMAGINNAIDKKTLEVQFADNAGESGLGDPIKLLEQLRQDAIAKSTFGFSINPDQVMKSIAARSVSVKATGLPGAQSMNITSESNTGNQKPQPDSVLTDDVRNLLILALDVPPSALNSLSENEFSRTVASMNLFFARKISQKQKTTITHLNNFVRNYVRYDGLLTKRIVDILTREDQTDNDPNMKSEIGSDTDMGTVGDKGSKLTEQEFDDLIKSISATLPKPNIAPDNAQFEQFRTFVDTLTNAIDQVYGEDLASNDPEALEALAVVKASMKTNLLTRYMQTMGLSEGIEFPTIENSVGSDIFNVRQFLINLKKGLDETKKHLSNGNAEEGGGSSSSW